MHRKMVVKVRPVHGPRRWWGGSFNHVMRRALWLLLGGFLLLVLSGCRVDSTVTIDIEGNGGGAVQVDVLLDAEATERLPDLDAQLQVQDLRNAGWDVTDPAPSEDGGTLLTATKTFASPDDLPVVLNEIGAFNSVMLTRTREFGATTWTFEGNIDITGGVDQFGDAELGALLGGRMTGVDVAAIETELRKPVAEMFGLDVIVQMADDVDANATSTDGRQASWVARIDDVAPTTMLVTSAVKDDRPRLLALIAIVLAIAAVVTLLFAGVWAARSRSRAGYVEPDPQYADPQDAGGAHGADAARKEVAGNAGSSRRGRSAPTIAQSATPAAAAAAASAAAGAATLPTPVPTRRLRSGAPQLVVLDAMGVIYRHGDDVEDLLIPFIEDNGGTATPDQIRNLYRQASLGQLSTSELWAGAGVDGDPATLDRAYLAQFRMTGGLLAFLDKLSHKKIPVACLSNDVALWSRLLRQGFGLDTKIGPWIVSGDIGARKPDQMIYDALRTTVGAPFDVYLFIDDRVENLDTARKLGMKTALFDPSGHIVDTNGHRVVRGFNEFFRR